MKTIEVDPRVPGIRDEIPGSHRQAVLSRARFPQLSIQFSVQSEITAFAGKTYRHMLLFCRESCFCREVFLFAVRLFFLPVSLSSFCREVFLFDFGPSLFAVSVILWP